MCTADVRVCGVLLLIFRRSGAFVAVDVVVVSVLLMLLWFLRWGGGKLVGGVGEMPCRRSERLRLSDMLVGCLVPISDCD